MSKQQTARPRPNTSNKQKQKYKPSNVPNAVSTPPQVAISEEARREARMQRQKEAQAAGQRRKRIQLMRRVGIAAAVVLVLVGLIAAFAINEANKPGTLVAMEPSPHLTAATDPHAPYTTDPPTSGPHIPQVPAWGVHTDVLAKELQVHGLEDGGVVINYQPDIDKATLDRLTAIVNTYPKELILSPYPGLSNPIVLTAWRRIDRLNAFDEPRIKRFITEYIGKDHHGESGS